VSRVVSSPNLLTDQGLDRFEIDPQIRIDLERKLRGSAEQIIGHYHSHPDHPAMPSATDPAMAFEPDLIWLIVSVRDGQAAEIKTHQLDQTANKFREVNCKIIN
jgi:proteasome lid subunit RPN8/RPN11